MKVLFQIRKKENGTELVLNPRFFESVDVIDLDCDSTIAISLRIKVRKAMETIYGNTLIYMIDKIGLAHDWNVEVRFLWIDFFEKKVVVHLRIPKLLDNLDRELLGLPLE